MGLLSEAIRRSISRRTFLKGVGSLAAAPIFAGLGGSALTGCSSSSSASSSPDSYNTKLVILGSSGGVGYWPGSIRASSSSALVVGNAIYLVDLGQGSTARLNEAFDSTSAVDSNDNYVKTSATFLGQVKALFFTHLHQDHIADYANLLLIGAGSNLGNYLDPPVTGWGKNPLQVIGPCNRGQRDKNNSPFFTDKDADAWVINAYSPVPPFVTPTPGTIQMTDMIWQAFAQAINDIMLDDGYPNYTSLVNVSEIGTQLPSQDSNTCPTMPPFQVYPLDKSKTEDENHVSVWATLVDHRQVYPAFAFRFNTPDGSVVFSGDTGPNTTADRGLPPQAVPNGNLQILANGADILVHEVIDTAWIKAKFPDENPLKTHMQNAHTQVEYVGQVAAYCNVKTLVLNHIIPGMAPISHLKQAQQGFPGQVIISHDLMRLGLSRFGSVVL